MTAENLYNINGVRFVRSGGAFVTEDRRYGIELHKITGGIGDEPVEWGVSFPSKGTIDVQRAMIFGHYIEAAAMLAAMLSEARAL